MRIVNLSIRTKIITIATGIIFFAIVAIVFVSNQYFIKVYSETLQSRSWLWEKA
jgi:hypothetical protein